MPQKLSLQVAPVDDVVFNNLVCARLPLQGPSQAPAPAPSSSQQYIAAPMMANASIPSPIYIEYAPVVYLHNQPSSGSDEWQSDLNSLITFLVRCGDVSTPCMYFPKICCLPSHCLCSDPECARLHPLAAEMQRGLPKKAHGSLLSTSIAMHEALHVLSM